MAEETQNVEQVEVEQKGSSIGKVQNYIENNKTLSIAVVAVVAVLVLGFFAYKNLYLAKQQDKAMTEMWKAEAAFRADSFNIALYGNDQITGFIDVINNYGGTESGNLAQYYAGVCCMQLGEYAEAIKYLKNFSTEDPILEPESICLLGDAYAENGDLNKAVSCYEKAANIADNEYISPRCLIKAGLVYEKLGKYSNAERAYTKIKTDYNGAAEMNMIEKYITRAQLKK